MGIEYHQDTLMPWEKRFEEEVDRKLFLEQERGRAYCKISMQGMMRGDAASRTTYYREMMMMGAMTQNEIRAFEDMNPIDNGDQYWIPSTIITLDSAIARADGPEDEPPAETPAADPMPAIGPPENTDQGSTGSASRELARRIVWAHAPAIERMLRKQLQIEADRIGRKGASFVETATFVDGVRAAFDDAISPCCTSVIACGITVDPRAIIDALARMHIEGTISGIADIALVSERAITESNAIVASIIDAVEASDGTQN